MSELLVESVDGVLVLTMNRPERRNALSERMRLALVDRLAREHASLTHRAIVLRGAAGSFCAGADLDLDTVLSRREVIEVELQTGVNRIVTLLRTLPVPVIASVDGAVAGAGVGFALAADLMLISDQARFVLSFTRLGAVPDAGVVAALLHRIGAARVTRVTMLGETLYAEELLSLGLAYAMVAPERLDAESIALAQSLARGPTRAYGLLKRIINAAQGTPDEHYLNTEASCQAQAFASEDFEEGVRAFNARRPPVFRGR
ncbi:MAG: enoyl-CoA hydratase-related protein [Myxococcota bacterium]